MFCRNCGAQISDDSQFCSSCGAPVEREEENKFCTFCGAGMPMSADVCPACGKSQGGSYAYQQSAPQYSQQSGEYNQSYGEYRQPYGQQYSQPVYTDVRNDQSELRTLIKIFMIVGVLSYGWTILPLLWLIPMTVKTFNAVNARTPLSIAFKICVFIFVSRIAGIMLFCLDD